MSISVLDCEHMTNSYIDVLNYEIFVSILVIIFCFWFIYTLVNAIRGLNND
jgi:hypothetical protein